MLLRQGQNLFSNLVENPGGDGLAVDVAGKCGVVLIKRVTVVLMDRGPK